LTFGAGTAGQNFNLMLLKKLSEYNIYF